MRRAAGRWTSGSILAVVLVAGAAGFHGQSHGGGAGQNPSGLQPPGYPGSQRDVMEGASDMPDAAKMEAQRARMANDERQKKMRADTEKLLRLATELKEEVEKSTKNEMSLAVIQKAAEIEKLSHDVKERMKN